MQVVAMSQSNAAAALFSAARFLPETSIDQCRRERENLLVALVQAGEGQWRRKFTSAPCARGGIPNSTAHLADPQRNLLGFQTLIRTI